VAFFYFYFLLFFVSSFSLSLSLFISSLFSFYFFLYTFHISFFSVGLFTSVSLYFCFFVAFAFIFPCFLLSLLSLSPFIFYLSFFLPLVYLPLFRFIFVSSLRLLLFSPVFYCLFGLYLRLSPQKPAIVSLLANSAHRLLFDLFCIISTAEGCSKSTAFIRRECGSSIAWPRGCDSGCRSRDNTPGCGVRNCVINLCALRTVLNPDAVGG
jgi:hypothetical protein